MEEYLRADVAASRHQGVTAGAADGGAGGAPGSCAERPRNGSRRRVREYRSTGFYSVKKLLSGPIDGRSSLGVALRTRVAEYEAHLGEPEDLPPATRRALRGIVGDEMILEIAESAILGGGVPWVVDRRARKLRRVVLDLMQVRDSVHKRAASLGLFTKREAKPLSLQDYLETTYGNGSADGEPAEDPAAAEDPAGTDAEAPGGPEGPSEGESAGERPLGAFPGEAAS